MTQQTQTTQNTVPDVPVRTSDVSSRMARILGALRARREAATLEEQSQTPDLAEQQPVEWALRLMM